MVVAGWLNGGADFSVQVVASWREERNNENGSFG